MHFWWLKGLPANKYRYMHMSSFGLCRMYLRRLSIYIAALDIIGEADLTRLKIWHLLRRLNQGRE